MTSDVLSFSLCEAAVAVRSREITPSELLEACLAQIKATDSVVGAFANVITDEARATAAELDEQIAGMSGSKSSDLLATHSPLFGVPIALKDLIFTEGVATEANCVALGGFVPEADATVVRRLRDAGAVIVGKTNTHELAYGVSCPASYNPWDTSRMTGGSSGGSAAALAARQVFGALGTDTGGSVRIPSNYCGTTGIKTTRGAVPRDGVHLISWTYDTVGPMARTAEDCGVLMSVMAGFSPADVYSSRSNLLSARPVESLRLGIPEDSFCEGFETDSEVQRVIDDAVAVLEGLVSKKVSVSPPTAADHLDAGCAVVFAESAALLEEVRTSKGDLIGDEPRAIMDQGAQIPGTALAEAQTQRQRIECDYLSMFEDKDVDVVITPITPNQVLAHGVNELDGVPLIPATTQFTFPVNGAGLPAIAIPGGFAADGLPIGFQLIGRPFSEHTLVAAAAAFQRETDYHRAAPPLTNT